jgi:hypothetical protein
LESKSAPHFIAKPSKGRGGEGIFFVKKASDLNKEDMRLQEYIAQEYIENPLLIDNKKFDFRLYLLVKGVDYMEAYIAFEGMARFCTEDYVPPTRKDNTKAEQGDVNENLMGHLTNYCLNRESAKYVDNKDFKNTDAGSKRLLSTMFKKLEAKGVDVDEIKAEIKDISTKIVLALQPFLVNSFHAEMGVGDEGNQN